MRYVEPASYRIEADDGRLSGASGRYEKKLKDLQGLYADADAFAAAVERQGDTIVYEVTDQRPGETQGDLIFGVTRMEPGRIGDEFYMTRGHIHAIANRPETYVGEAGEGVMLMESPEGEVRIAEIHPRTLCYVPPFWIHRSINTGNDPLVMSFCYPADAGQDYAVIERSGGMKCRIVADAGTWREVPNRRYRPRDSAEIAAILATANN